MQTGVSGETGSLSHVSDCAVHSESILKLAEKQP